MKKFLTLLTFLALTTSLSSKAFAETPWCTTTTESDKNTQYDDSTFRNQIEQTYNKLKKLSNCDAEKFEKVYFDQSIIFKTKESSKKNSKPKNYVREINLTKKLVFNHRGGLNMVIGNWAHAVVDAKDIDATIINQDGKQHAYNEEYKKTIYASLEDYGFVTINASKAGGTGLECGKDQNAYIYFRNAKLVFPEGTTKADFEEGGKAWCIKCAGNCEDNVGALPNFVSRGTDGDDDPNTNSRGEDCFDGVDNNNNDLTDKEDPLCDEDQDEYIDDDVDGGDDCDDKDPEVNPGKDEIPCDDKDNDCDPETPDDVDCGPQEEICDGKDNDLDLEVDEGCDDDKDEYIDDDLGGDDCDDNDFDTHPNARELCDEVDNDCDGNVDENCEGEREICGDNIDNDLDLEVDEGCDDDQDDHIDDDLGGDDCDDEDANTYPGAPELCDGKDNDCDPNTDFDVDCPVEVCDGVDNNNNNQVDEGCDDDQDDHIDDDLGGDDCDDNDADVNPDAPEICDGKDNDCDGKADNVDSDNDGFSGCDDDCDDNDDTINPDAPDSCGDPDGINNDCDDQIDEENTYYLDSDGDGFGAPGTDLTSCTDPGDDYVDNNEDCDDADPETNPDAEEDTQLECNDVIDNDCDGLVDGQELLCEGLGPIPELPNALHGSGCSLNTAQKASSSTWYLMIFMIPWMLVAAFRARKN